MEVYDVLPDEQKFTYIQDFLNGGQDSKYHLCVQKTIDKMNQYKFNLETADLQAIKNENNYVEYEYIIDVIIYIQELVTISQLAIKLLNMTYGITKDEKFRQVIIDMTPFIGYKEDFLEELKKDLEEKLQYAKLNNYYYVIDTIEKILIYIN